jgi:hypothetical protein
VWVTGRHLHIISYGVTGFLDLVHHPVFEKTLKATTFQKLDQFPSSGEGVGAPPPLGQIERANLNEWTSD